MPPRYRVLIVDDHTMVAEAFAVALRPYFDVVGLCHAGDEVGACLGTIPVDVLLLELCLAGQEGLDLIADVRRRYPATRMLVVSIRRDRETAEVALQCGAQGFVPKNDPLASLINAVQEVAEGRRYVSRSIPPRTVRPGLRGTAAGLERLTPRQVAVVGLVAEGLTSAQIAMRLGLSVYTVGSHRKQILRKLGLTSQVGLVRWATLMCAAGSLSASRPAALQSTGGVQCEW